MITHVSTDYAAILKEPYPPPPLIAWDAAIKTVSEANAHAHWRTRSRRAKLHRVEAGLRTLAAPPDARQAAKRELAAGGLLVTLTRVAPSSGLDSDNLASSQKHIRDGIADALGVDDRDARITWSYVQQRGPYAVRCIIEPRPVLPSSPAARFEFLTLCWRKKLITKRQLRRLLEEAATP